MEMEMEISGFCFYPFSCRLAVVVFLLNVVAHGNKGLR
jgi:hypothetical protein